MRQNVKQAIDTFEGLRIGRVPSITASGDAIYSYATCIATRDTNLSGHGLPIRVIINVTKYSATTSQLQAALRQEYPNALLIDGLDRNVSANDLRMVAVEQVPTGEYASKDHKHNYAPHYCTECGKRNPDND